MGHLNLFGACVTVSAFLSALRVPLYRSSSDRAYMTRDAKACSLLARVSSRVHPFVAFELHRPSLRTGELWLDHPPPFPECLP